MNCPKCGNPREYKFCLDHFHDPPKEITPAELECNAPLQTLLAIQKALSFHPFQ
jgi:hypothetical protein